jgi:uncharacterized DUF497 family protein
VEFEWDASNLRKHGVDFASIADLDWAHIRESEDRRKDYGECRWVAFGRIGDRVHVLIYTHRGRRIRVISLRRANDEETDAYEGEA